MDPTQVKVGDVFDVKPLSQPEWVQFKKELAYRGFMLVSVDERVKDQIETYFQRWDNGQIEAREYFDWVYPLETSALVQVTELSPVLVDMRE